MPSLKEVADRLVAHCRNGTEAKGLDAVVELPVVGCSLRMAELYRDVTFPSPPPGILREEE